MVRGGRGRAAAVKNQALTVEKLMFDVSLDWRA
jgi:hypothetical protein